MARCRAALRPIAAELTQRDWGRRPIFTDVRVGDFILVQNWGQINCLPLRQSLPQGRLSNQSSHEQGTHLRPRHALRRL
eukprot:8962010-Pyramimonas_sp.AAC.1